MKKIFSSFIIALIWFIAANSYAGESVSQFELIDKAENDAEAGNFMASLRNCDKAILIDPNFALAYYYRGLIYSLQEDYKHAIEDLTKALTYQGKIVSSCIQVLEEVREDGDGDYTIVCNRGRGGLGSNPDTGQIQRV
jgi:tetratricopeptide (TPR) repeat protein